MRVALTGGLASGKSTMARRLREAGMLVIDADELVAELYASGGRGVAIVRELFGSHLLEADGSVDHPRLARHVFSDGEALARLEDRIHPLVREVFAHRSVETSAPVVLEGTRIVEAGYAPDFDLIISVEASAENRLERAIARGLSREQAHTRLAAQGDGELRRRAAHRIIWNDGSLEQLTAEADKLASEILRYHGDRCGDDE